MEDTIALWPRPVEGDFQPFLEMSILDHPRRKNAGLVLVLPGGGYRNRASYEGVPVAKKFNELGWHAATLEYRVAPSVFPAPQQDAIRALKAGDRAGHDRMVLEMAAQLADRDVIVLAQASMAHMEKAVAEQTGIATLSSPARCIAEIKDILEAIP